MLTCGLVELYDNLCVSSSSIFLSVTVYYCAFYIVWCTVSLKKKYKDFFVRQKPEIKLGKGGRLKYDKWFRQTLIGNRYCWKETRRKWLSGELSLNYFGKGEEKNVYEIVEGI